VPIGSGRIGKTLPDAVGMMIGGRMIITDMGSD
jgi:hypothetical protein